MYAGVADPDEELEPEQTIYEVLASYTNVRKSRIQAASIVRPIKTNLAILQANGELGALDLELVNALSRETILKQALEPLRPQYDYILLDCPPDLSLVVVNALAAADEVIIPLQAEYLATRGVKRLLRIVDFVKERVNPRLKIGGIAVTMADTRTTHTKDIIKATRDSFAGQIKVFDSIIKTSVRLKEAPVSGTSILEYDPTGESAKSYRALAQEVDHGK
jgi:chromosome partitioning protein